MQKPTPQKPNLAHLAASWPSPLVSRDNVEKFTGGIITQKTIANHDSKGTGPQGRVKIGRKVAYPVNAFIEWLESRAEVL
jgi:predicted DNA-binding transcriptional regulator AlpA